MIPLRSDSKVKAWTWAFLGYESGINGRWLI
jgi:hypothetical protein